MRSEPDLLGLHVPPGFRFQEEFISSDDERALLDGLHGVTFDTFEMRGVVARRRVAFFGESYDRAHGRTVAGLPWPLRRKIAEWRSCPSAPSRWHSSTSTGRARRLGGIATHPNTTSVAGVSLLSACRMRFRPYRFARGEAAGGGGATNRQP
jgi:alkylated DNA repair dioxygenase AlkB